MNFKKAFTAAIIIALTGCASGGVKRGQVVMKTSGDEAHVGFGSTDVNVGDHVELYHNECTRETVGKNGGGGGTRSCTKVGTGHGEVTQIINGDYSLVKFAPGTKFTEGDTVEKHAH